MISRLLVFAFALFAGAGDVLAQQDVQIQARDGITVHGDFFAAPGDPRGTILLFHQARSNRGEYATITPDLAACAWTSFKPSIAHCHSSSGEAMALTLPTSEGTMLISLPSSSLTIVMQFSTGHTSQHRLQPTHSASSTQGMRCAGVLRGLRAACAALETGVLVNPLTGASGKWMHWCAPSQQAV